MAGFTCDVGQEELARWRRADGVGAMLAHLNRIQLSPGSAILVPAGVPHGIGAHMLGLEPQQPTDFPIGLEGHVPGSDRVLTSDLGLGEELARAAVDRDAWPPRRLAGLVGPGGPGRGQLRGGAHDTQLELSRRSTGLVPFGTGRVEVAGDVGVIVGQPGDPAVNRPSRPVV